MARAFEGIRVLDFSTIFAGPFAAERLAQMGADVIKVEPPETGDTARRMMAGPAFAEKGLSPIFLSVNAGKRSMTLDLKHPQAKEIVHRLVRDSDVFIQNFKGGVIDRLTSQIVSGPHVAAGHNVAAASAVKVVVSMPGGYGSDRFGRTPVLVLGWGGRILVLTGLGLTAADGWTVWMLFLAYAGCLALTEGAERALIGDFAPAGKKATAFGLYHMTAGLLALPGALLFGALWQWFGEAAAFLTAAGLTALSVTALVAITARKKGGSSE